jgi:hypothetical protein
MGRLSRRQFLDRAAAAVLLSPGLAMKGSVMSEKPQASSAENARGAEAMDAALTLLAKTGPEYHGGLSNHGPMAAEALVSLERPDAVVPWVERYSRSLMDHPTGTNRIEPAAWREALGDYRRAGDWITFFRRQVEERPWPAALSEWCEKMAPGLSAAAFHGLIRTAHAARSLSRREAPARRLELAEGLAYWAARYGKLPEAEEGKAPRCRPSEAIASVEIVEPSRRGHGDIIGRLAPLRAMPSFARVADLIDTGGDAGLVISDMTETFAGVFLAHAVPGTTIALVHAVTGPSAVRLLAPHVEPSVTRAMLRYSWQAAAAIYATSALPTPDTAPRPQPKSRGDLVDRALYTGDEHAFKFTEACLREHAINAKPVYLAAALEAVRRLGSPGA